MSNEPIAQPEAQTPPAAYFLSLSIANFRCFKEEQTLDLSDGNGKPAMWTILLGENGTGKTTALQAIAGCHPDGVINRGKSGFAISYSYWKFFNAYVNRDKLDIKFKMINNSKFVDGFVSIDNDGSSNYSQFYEECGDLYCVGYNAFRKNGKFLLGSEYYNSGCMGLFDPEFQLVNAIEWLVQADYAAKTTGSEKSVTRLELVKSMLKKLLPGIENFLFEVTDDNAMTPLVKVFLFNEWIPLQGLSVGYQTSLAWMVDFASRMLNRYPDSPNPLAEPAVCLVDEIDLHMHPKWQRELIKMLSETFPKTQFIVTAHSPLIVQAAPNANVALLRREGDHVVIENGWEKARNWRVDQIFASDLFDAGALSDEVRDALRRRRELAQKAGRTEADEAELAVLNAKLDALPGEAGAQEATVDEMLRYAEMLLQKK